MSETVDWFEIVGVLFRPLNALFTIVLMWCSKEREER